MTLKQSYSTEKRLFRGQLFFQIRCQQLKMPSCQLAHDNTALRMRNFGCRCIFSALSQVRTVRFISLALCTACDSTQKQKVIFVHLGSSGICALDSSWGSETTVFYGREMDVIFGSPRRFSGLKTWSQGYDRHHFWVRGRLKMLWSFLDFPACYKFAAQTSVWRYVH